MVEQYLWQSPLAPLKLEARAVARPGEAGVVLAERSGLGMIELRGDAGDAAFRAETERTLGFARPFEPNTVAEGRRRRSLWLGPEQWLVVTAPGEAGALARELDRALHDLPASAVE
ncbi:MAG: sarcosine oxidase subunit gamma family protein, partial [Alphaproteobacteria bacterium]